MVGHTGWGIIPPCGPSGILVGGGLLAAAPQVSVPYRAEPPVVS